VLDKDLNFLAKSFTFEQLTAEVRDAARGRGSNRSSRLQLYKNHSNINSVDRTPLPPIPALFSGIRQFFGFLTTHKPTCRSTGSAGPADIVGPSEITAEQFETYEAIILSEQMPASAVPRFMHFNPAFDSWYRARRRLGGSSTRTRHGISRPLPAPRSLSRSSKYNAPRLAPDAARLLLESCGIPLGSDFNALTQSQTAPLLDEADRRGYRSPRNSRMSLTWHFL
jgi:hypothetical protein